VNEPNEEIAEAGAELRRSPRTNLLLAATAEVNGRAVDVRIRNVSETGALIEGAGLPDIGGRLLLRRGDLQIGGEIAWSGGNRRGVRFDGPVETTEWTGGRPPKPLDCTGLRDQRRVDSIQAAVRNGTPAAERAGESASATMSRKEVDARLAEELAFVRRLLASIGDQMITDPALVERHSRGLQDLDLAGQILAHLAAIIMADDQSATIDRLGMEDLRSRLKRSLAAAA
jgi:PilZ domain-containing protein